jgi:hypothetical protein
MRTVASVAKNRAIRLQQELVAILRETGSIEGAKLFWHRVDFKNGFGRKLACYGFEKRERQLLINKVAFPDLNFIEVDAALKAGNKLRQLYELASGCASIAQDSNGLYKPANKGLMIVPIIRSRELVSKKVTAEQKKATKEIVSIVRRYVK